MSVLSDRMAAGASTICRAWIVRRNDGVVLGFTDHDVELTVAGVICRASSGLTAGALETSTGMSVDNTEARGALSDSSIRAEDIRAGLWDDADIAAYLVDWTSPDAFEVLFRGTLGEITWGNGAFSAEIRGQAEKLNKTRGRVYQKRCDAVLGDERCGKVLDAAYVVETIITAVDSNQAFSTVALPQFVGRWFEGGQVRVLSGAAAGMSARVKTDRAADGRRAISLWQELRFDISVGDQVRMEAGCDKGPSTCRSKFSNFVNFRGFPSVPGEDWLMAYPTTGSRNDGGSL